MKGKEIRKRLAKISQDYCQPDSVIEIKSGGYLLLFIPGQKNVTFLSAILFDVMAQSPPDKLCANS